MQFKLRVKVTQDGVNEASFLEWVKDQECNLETDYFFSSGSNEAVLTISPADYYIGFANSVSSLIDFCADNIVD